MLWILKKTHTCTDTGPKQNGKNYSVLFARWAFCSGFWLCRSIWQQRKRKHNQVIKVKNVWETLEWVGRRPEELKLAGAEASGNTGIDFSGDWYGHVVKGTAYVKKNYSSPQREAVVYEIFFTDGLPYYDAMIRDIEKRYGKPYIQAEEPYVESNGGCVQHDYYWTGKGSIHISVAEKHDFYVFRYHLSEKPKQVK